MKRQSILFAQLLTRAADRVYLTPVSLGEKLLHDASQTLHILRTKTETLVGRVEIRGCLANVGHIKQLIPLPESQMTCVPWLMI